ncbi:MAG: ClpXP protease specificity-enhancing factor [Rhodoferax sp.]|uniref:ClpXP protease specificity-enhancing factor n=1 Tax=Rhodoferax sp. TaxID=50421 RepID=UPI00271CCB99|nr:ClpXP protease specificity-enhancing factor [Rhodoferax sp.]MDO8451221.1 ClpXP protease specificity-enhancing factor [Rhodoferax sp.]
MIDAPDATSTRPYLIRALYEWCTDNGFTPYVAVAVDDSVQVPREYVKDGEIVLNISLDATSSLKLGNDFIEFKARFAGTAREIMVPVSQVSAIYARENGQGMVFPLGLPKGAKTAPSSSVNLVSVPDGAYVAQSEDKVVQLTSVESDRRNDEPNDQPDPPRPASTGPRPALKRVK